MKLIIKRLIAFSLLLFLSACNNEKKADHTRHNNADNKKEPVKKEMAARVTSEVQLESLLKPTNQYVISTIPVTTIKKDSVRNN